MKDEIKTDEVVGEVVEVPPILALDKPEYYTNRELSLLEFQRRVLQEAQDEANPLLERAKFLAIVNSNLDEFFMVRVAGLKQQIDAGVADRTPDGMTAAEQLAQVRRVGQELLVDGQTCLLKDIVPKLDKAGIHLLNYDKLKARQRTAVGRYFDEVIFPVLTPLAFDPGHPFPHISHLSLNLAVLIRDDQGHRHFARLKVPGTLPRLVPVKGSSGGVRKDGTVPHHHYFVWLEQVIKARIDALFPGMEVIESHPFHVTRDADMDIQELEALDLLETIEQGLRQRRFGQVVRVMVNPAMPQWIRDILVRNLELDTNDIYTLPGPLDISSLMSLLSIDRFDLKDAPFKPALSPAFASEKDKRSIFSAIRRGDVLVHHPYDSFIPVVEFLQSAARDPNVLAIKQTLYRVGRNSPVVKALLEARENGKQVAVLVELKARFDEESNITWARALEREGVHVVYGLLGLKTHCKIALVVRKEDDHIRRYVHLSTGNYNALTAHIYTDIGFFTCDPKIGEDASHLFNFLTGYSAKRDYHKLLVAPISLRESFERLIKREIEHQKTGRKGHLIFKTNALIDIPMIRLLYEASVAGVKVDLLVRGICSLRPGIEGLSENIRVISVVGRFLEHSRIYYFANGNRPEIYLGSADLMSRNLDHRVEALFPIEDRALIRYLRKEVLNLYLADNSRARIMKPDGSYERRVPEEGAEVIDSQAVFLRRRQLQPRESEAAVPTRFSNRDT